VEHLGQVEHLANVEHLELQVSSQEHPAGADHLHQGLRLDSEEILALSASQAPMAPLGIQAPMASQAL
jgi:hypothetical protein